MLICSLHWNFQCHDSRTEVPWLRGLDGNLRRVSGKLYQQREPEHGYVQTRLELTLPSGGGREPLDQGERSQKVPSNDRAHPSASHANLFTMSWSSVGFMRRAQGCQSQNESLSPPHVPTACHPLLSSRIGWSLQLIGQSKH